MFFKLWRKIINLKTLLKNKEELKFLYISETVDGLKNLWRPEGFFPEKIQTDGRVLI